MTKIRVLCLNTGFLLTFVETDTIPLYQKGFCIPLQNPEFRP